MTLRIGLIAASRISVEAVLEPAAEIDDIEVTAVAARDADRAAAFARQWGIGLSLGSYQELIDSDAVDAIYVGTPAALHREWAIRGLDAGKHVLVEKPLASNAGDARLIADAASSSPLVAMEAFHWRYHPLASQMREVLDSGVLGHIQQVDGVFTLDSSVIPRHDIRWQLDLGGGAMMDLGVYPAGWAMWVMGETPGVVSAEAVCPVEGVDGRLEARFEWPGGTKGTLLASMIEDEGRLVATLDVEGSEGTMHVDNPLHPQRGASLVVETGDGRTEQEVPTTTTYFHQLVAFRDAVEKGAPFPTTIEAGVRTMELIDDCYRAAGLEPRPTR